MFLTEGLDTIAVVQACTIGLQVVHCMLQKPCAEHLLCNSLRELLHPQNSGLGQEDETVKRLAVHLAF